ncbi:hypothetical protein LZ31DRAFT_475379, partial [Colletotrichum somersetense]
AEAEQHAVRLLTAAAGRMGDALRGMDDALSRCSSRMGDAFGGGSVMTDMRERGALQRAEAAVREARGLVAQAGRVTPHVACETLPPVAVVDPDGGGALLAAAGGGVVLFDSASTDAAFRNEVGRSRASVERCAAAVGGMLRETRARHRRLTRRLGAQGVRLESTRTALQREREKVFERIAGGGRQQNGDAEGAAAAEEEEAAASGDNAEPVEREAPVDQ